MNRAFYNDNDPFCCQWLRNLINAKVITSELVKEGNIRDVQAKETRRFVRCHFFAGIGGWELALNLAGWPEDVPVWTGSCPCQPFSDAGKKQGYEDERHLWPIWGDLIAQCKPPVIFGEQVASSLGREWLDGVRADLEDMGYAVGAADLCAASLGAPHRRQRLFWVAISEGRRLRRRERATSPATPEAAHGCYLGHANGAGLQGGCVSVGQHASQLAPEPPSSFRAWDEYELVTCHEPRADAPVRRRVEPSSFPLAHGLPSRMGSALAEHERLALLAAKANWRGRLRGYGNAIVPQVAALFVSIVIDFLTLEQRK